ncbi:hypothetical protein [Moorena sp. SIO3I6]|nr:hypothetical protein [Moorena sp. SIO3I6]NEP26042.1 hypothetical protein [Moorena sp. SIO3I6]
MKNLEFRMKNEEFIAFIIAMRDRDFVCLLPIPCSLFPVPCSLFPVP